MGGWIWWDKIGKCCVCFWATSYERVAHQVQHTTRLPLVTDVPYVMHSNEPAGLVLGCSQYRIQNEVTWYVGSMVVCTVRPLSDVGNYNLWISALKPMPTVLGICNVTGTGC